MWCYCQSYQGSQQLQGKTAVITGANTGIGKETAKDLYNRGCRVVMLCRDMQKAASAMEEIKTDSAKLTNVGALSLIHLDLGDLSQVRECAEKLLQNEPEIHLLINNAGIFGCPQLKTKDGYDIHFGTNHLGHFLLTLLLLPRILRSESARIINLSSIAHNFPGYGRHMDFDDLHFERRRYNISNSYGQSKLANVMFTRELARRLKEAHFDKVTVYSLHPGIVASELGRNFDGYMPGFSWLWKYCGSWVLMTPKQGAQTTLYCALEPKLASESGLYYSNCSVTTPASLVNDEQACKRLWDVSVNLTNLGKYDPFAVEQFKNANESARVRVSK